MITVTLRNGLNHSLTMEVEEGTTIREALTPVNKEALRLPESFTQVIDGRTVDLDTEINHQDVIQFERQAATKA